MKGCDAPIQSLLGELDTDAGKVSLSDRGAELANIDAMLIADRFGQLQKRDAPAGTKDRRWQVVYKSIRAENA